MSICLRSVFLSGFLLVGHALAADPEALPEPLTLTDAVRLSLPAVPGMLRAEAAMEAARAQQLSADAVGGFQVTATGRLRAIEPTYKSPDNDANDSSATIALRKRLYDFGYQDALSGAAGHALDAGGHRRFMARQEARLSVMRAFYDVILADLEFARDNEAMSIAFIAADRARDRNELGQMSDVDLFEAEAEYQETRRRQNASSSRQLLTRSRLALAMGRPGELVSDLVPPLIELPETEPGDFQAFWQEIMERNPELRALKSQRLAARQKLAAARKSRGPVLSAEMDASIYNRNTASTHPLGGGLVLEVPLLDGGQRNAALARAQAEVTEAEASLLEARLRLEQQTRELWAARRVLRADIQAFDAQLDYRDLYLDRSRALYELEVKTDLGDAMTRITEARLNKTQALFAWSMNEARLKAMVGQMLEGSQ